MTGAHTAYMHCCSAAPVGTQEHDATSPQLTMHCCIQPQVLAISRCNPLQPPCKVLWKWVFAGVLRCLPPQHSVRGIGRATGECNTALSGGRQRCTCLFDAYGVGAAVRAAYVCLVWGWLPDIVYEDVFVGRSLEEVLVGGGAAWSCILLLARSRGAEAYRSGGAAISGGCNPKPCPCIAQRYSLQTTMVHLTVLMSQGAHGRGSTQLWVTSCHAHPSHVGNGQRAMSDAVAHVMLR
jgi:hypothetical protein